MPALLTLVLLGGTYRLSTSGTDVADAGAWRTWDFAVPRLRPGDTLVVEPGVWTWNDGGTAQIDCLNVAANGLPDAGILVRAQDERTARVVTNGLEAGLFVRDCAYWTIEGLTVIGDDFPNGNSTVFVRDSNHVTLRRLLVSKDNRYVNSMPVTISGSDRVLLEDSEVYDFFRVGVLVYASTDTTVRRVYAHPRGRPALGGGYPRNYPDTADDGFADHSDRSRFENVISERSHAAFQIFAEQTHFDAELLGSISVDETVGVLLQQGVNGAYPTRTTVRDFVALRPDDGIVVTDARQTRIDACSVLGARGNGISAGQARAGATMLSTFVTRTLATGRDAGTAFTMSMQAAFGLSDLDADGFPSAYQPPTGTGLRQLDPKLVAGCAVMIPPSSPLKAAASDGGDIGANVLYRVEDGVVTSTPLWSPGFPCGAIVAGINDVPDASCFDVHQRIGVACPFPPGYLPTPDGGADGGADAGTDAGIDAGIDAGTPGADGGFAGPKSYAVGCGCSAGPGPFLLLVLLHAVRRRLRNFRAGAGIRSGVHFLRPGCGPEGNAVAKC